MKKFILSFFLALIFTQLDAITIDLDALCQGKKQEVVKFEQTEKPGTSKSQSPSTYYCRGALISSEGHIMVSDYTKDYDNFTITWIDANDFEHVLDAALVSVHPTEEVVILKVDHPFGGMFPQPKLSFNRLKASDWVLVVTNEIESKECLFQIGKIIKLIMPSRSSFEGLYGKIGLVWRGGQQGAPVYNSQGEMVGIVGGPSDELSWIRPFFPIEQWIKETLGL